MKKELIDLRTKILEIKNRVIEILKNSVDKLNI